MISASEPARRWLARNGTSTRGVASRDSPSLTAGGAVHKLHRQKEHDRQVEERLLVLHERVHPRDLAQTVQAPTEVTVVPPPADHSLQRGAEDEDP